MSQSPKHSTTTLPQPVIIITGASSGIGRAFFNHFTNPSRSDLTHRVLCIDKEPWTDSEGARHDTYYPQTPQGSVYARLDLTATIDQHQAFLRRWIDDTTPISLVLHCAGVRGLVPHVPIARSDDVATAETLDAMDASTLMRTYEINVVGTFNVISALLPGLKTAARLDLRPRVMVLSSRMGSIGANEKGGGYAYRASKAALNALLKSMSLDVPDVFFAMVHPGRVETGLVSVKEDGAISCEESLQDLLPLMDRFGNEEGLGSGCFVDRFGERIQW